MLAAALVLLGCGAPFVVMGFYFRKKPKKKKRKGSKRLPKQEASGTSFLIGGGLMSLIGIVFLVMHFMN